MTEPKIWSNKKVIQPYCDVSSGVPEGGAIPNVKVPTMSYNPTTKQRTIAFKTVPNNTISGGQQMSPLNSVSKFMGECASECVYVETKYYWVKNIKNGKNYMASERIEKQDGKLISCWSVRDGPDCYSSTGFAKEGILERYDIIEQVCPPTSVW